MQTLHACMKVAASFLIFIGRTPETGAMRSIAGIEHGVVEVGMA